MTEYVVCLIHPDWLGDDLSTIVGVNGMGHNDNFEASDDWETAHDVTDVKWIRLYAQSMDFSFGQVLKTTIAPGQIGFQFGLEQETPRPLAFGEVWAGHMENDETRRYLYALNYAVLKWSKEANKLTSLLIYEDGGTEDSDELLTYHQYYKGDWVRYRGGLQQFKTFTDPIGNIMIPQLVLEGAWT